MQGLHSQRATEAEPTSGLPRKHLAPGQLLGRDHNTRSSSGGVWRGKRGCAVRVGLNKREEDREAKGAQREGRVSRGSLKGGRGLSGAVHVKLAARDPASHQASPCAHTALTGCCP